MSAAVRLTYDELREAAYIGIMRRVASLKRGRSERYGSPDLNPWVVDIESSAAEKATSKLTGLAWAAAVRPDYDGDVGPFEVRYTPRDDGGLILHPDDPDERLYILVTGREGSYVVRGCMIAALGKLPEFWRRDWARPAYCVPQRLLDPIDELLP